MNETKHPGGHVLQAYQDGELDESATADVAAHCEHCAACQAELADLQRVRHLLAGSPTPELPRTVWHRVRPGRSRETRFKPVFAFAAGAAGIVLGILMGPVEFNIETTGTDLTWSETVTVWDAGASSTLLDVYQFGQE